MKAPDNVNEADRAAAPYTAPVSFGIKSWAEDDRPREKLMAKGNAALSNAEYLAILLGSGTVRLSAVDVGKLILQGVDEDLNALGRLSIKQLCKFPGVGQPKPLPSSRRSSWAAAAKKPTRPPAPPSPARATFTNSCAPT